ncbi:MAG: hypothetical protein JXB45_04405, partial [Candidatus Krumholzibacteriota bacterium]|nr:hypothetical protein [Candidatus Krumholzibacteriota bacterium]
GLWPDRAPLMIFSLFPIIYFLIVGFWSMRAARYLMPITPLAAGLAAFCIFRLADLPHPGRRFRPFILIVLSLAALVQPARQGISSALVIHDTRELARRWLDVNAPPHSLIIKEKLTPDLWTKKEFTRLKSGMNLQDMAAEQRQEISNTLNQVRTFRVVEIPLYANNPKASDPYYDLRFFIEADYVVTSSSVKNRYLSDPERFPRQKAFYSQLAAYWTEIAVFKPRAGTAGPVINIFHQRDDTPARMKEELGWMESFSPGKWQINKVDLHEFAKELAETATLRQNYTLAEFFFHLCDPNDPDVHYFYAGMLALSKRYPEMLDWLTGLARRSGLLPPPEGGGGSPRSANRPEDDFNRRRIAELLRGTLEDPLLEEGIRNKILAFLEGLEADDSPPGEKAPSPRI